MNTSTNSNNSTNESTNGLNNKNNKNNKAIICSLFIVLGAIASVCNFNATITTATIILTITSAILYLDKYYKPNKPDEFFKVSTHNVELWNGMFDIIYQDGENNPNKHNRKVKSFEINEPKRQQLNEYFKNTNVSEQIPHILGLQESIFATNGTDRWSHIGSMTRVAQVKAQDATWETTAALNSNGVTHASLTNEIYTSPDIEFISAREKVISRNDINPKRVMCIVTLKIYGKHIITIGCLHTTGGRFDDKRMLWDTDFAEEKKHQFKSILEENLDIFMGDFNLKRYRQHVIESSQKWKDVLEAEAMKEGKTVDRSRVNEWNDWMYIDHPSSSNNISKMISDNGYIDASEIGNIKDTSMFGGQIDYIFVKENKFTPVSARTYGQDWSRSDHTIVEVILKFN
jgi:endonuclease/exonuclease/phosphatase family metal-dependent hydrolase